MPQSYFRLRIFLTFILVSSLSACGGGGGASGKDVIASSKALSSESSVVASVASEAAAELNSSSVVASIASEASVASSSSLRASSSSSLASSSSRVSASSRSSVLSSSSLTIVRSSSSMLASSSSSAWPKTTFFSLSAPKTELVVGEQIEITVNGIDPRNLSEPWWFVGNRDVIAIKGRTLTALAVGTTWLGADATSPTGSVSSNNLTFTVKEAPAVLQGIKIDAAQSGVLLMDSLRQLQVTGNYSNAASKIIANSEVTFISANSQVAEINAQGVIQPRAPGKTIITASYKGKTAAYEIEVASPGIVFHLLKPTSWNSTVNAHWFAPKVLGLTQERLSTFPGSPMQDLDGDGWYDITLNGLEEINILFNDGGSVGDGFHQTADLIGRKGGWLVLDEFPNPAGKYYGTWYDSKPDLVAQPVCDVKTFGAKGDGATKDTMAIQKAIDACAGKNGIVRLRDGKFVSGTIVLKSDMTLRIEPSATLLGTRDAADYPDQPKLTGNSQYLNCRKALIYSERANNIRIDGGGTIDGNGGTGSPWMTGLEATRPMAIFLVQTDGITLQNITVKNSAMWTVVPFESSNITIRGVTVNSLTGHNLDGIDIVDGHHVLIESVDITSQDDAICLKSGLADRGVVDVMVRYSKVNKSSVANGLKFGTATRGPFRDITFDNISLNNVTRGGIAVESVDGSAVSNIVYRNITMDKVGTPFYMVLGYRSKDANAIQNVGSIDHVTFENIVATNTTKTWGSYMSGVTINGETFRLSNLLFKNIDLTFLGGSTNIATPWEYNASYTGEYPDPGPSTNTGNKKDMPGYLYFRHADNVKLVNAKLSVAPQDTRPYIVTDDVINYSNDTP